MTKSQWDFFSKFKEDFKDQIKKWNKYYDQLKILQKDAAVKAKTPDYPFETPVVYNRALDEITPEDQIKIIVIGDNPGKDEQLEKNNKYLVGQAGKLGEGFFKKNPQLETDFRKNVIILNKTPVHSAKTNHLKDMIKAGGSEINLLIEETQRWMAENTLNLAKNLDAKIWLVGYSELKPKGIFKTYGEIIKSARNTDLWERIFVYQHFSMNRFSIDLADYKKKNPKDTLQDSLTKLGYQHRDEIFE